MAKQKCPEFENHERWLVSYADMLTLLFAVFVVLYALGLDKASSKSQEETAGSLQESFNKPLDDIPDTQRVGPQEIGFGIFEHFRGNQARPPMTKKFPGSKDTIKIIEEEMQRVRIMVEERLYGPNKFRDNKDPGQARIVDIEQTKNGFKLKLVAKHFYSPGQIEMRQQALKDLDGIASILKELGRPIIIEGHTDSQQPKGGMNNWDLSALRATHILRYFIKEHSFPSSRLSAAGYADSVPIASNATESGRSLNRRIEIKVNYFNDAVLGIE